MSNSNRPKVLVTGASSGIGQAIAELLSQNGFTVLGTTRDVSGQDQSVAWQWVPLDLRGEDSINALPQQVGEVDFLVNSAGKAYLSSLIDGEAEQWDEMWEVNVRGLALVTKVMLPQISSTGAVINISSLSGHRVPPSGGFYSPTKFAVRALTESLRLELRGRGSSIRVGSISPGFVDTPLLNDYFDGRDAALEQLRKSATMLKPEDVAAVVMTWVLAEPYVELGDISLRSVAQSI